MHISSETSPFLISLTKHEEKRGELGKSVFHSNFFFTSTLSLEIIPDLCLKTMCFVKVSLPLTKLDFSKWFDKGSTAFQVPGDWFGSRLNSTIMNDKANNGTHKVQNQEDSVVLWQDEEIYTFNGRHNIFNETQRYYYNQ